jgi:hypothetical protein
MDDLAPHLAVLADPGADMDARFAAAALLGRSREPAAVTALAAALADPVVAPEAIVALGVHGGAAALDTLRAEWQRRRAATELAAGEAPELRALVDTAVALARHGDLVGEPDLIQLVSSPAWDVRLAAVRGLAWFPTPGAAVALARAHDDDEDEVVERAARSLASYGCADAVPLWLERIERGGRPAEGFGLAAFELLGDAAPRAEDTASEWRRWWMRAADQIATDQCLWMGEPASPAVAIEPLTGDDGELARRALVYWTGIDFVADPEPEAGGDDDDAERARAWWAEHEHGWQVGALYRAGRPFTIAPIAAALRRLT